MSRRPPHRFREYPMTLTETDCTAPVASIPQPPLDLHRLEQFVAVVETGSLTDAAVRLSVSQQALSVAIRALEKQVGVTLFIRGKGMRPSPAGLHLYESAQILLAAARRMVPELRAIGEAHTERLRVGYTPSVSSIDVLETIGNRVPATAHLQAERLFHRTLRDRLLAGEIDIALRRGGGTPRGLGNAVVRFDRLNVAVRTEHAESIRKSTAAHLRSGTADRSRQALTGSVGSGITVEVLDVSTRTMPSPRLRADGHGESLPGRRSRGGAVGRRSGLRIGHHETWKPSGRPDHRDAAARGNPGTTAGAVAPDGGVRSGRRGRPIHQRSHHGPGAFRRRLTSTA